MKGIYLFLNWFIKEWNTRFKINNQNIDTLLYYKMELLIYTQYTIFNKSYNKKYN